MGMTTGTCVVGSSRAARFVADSTDDSDLDGLLISMNTLSGREVLEAVGGLLTWGGQKATFRRVCTDSRKALPGDVFFPLVGETFDGHDYIGSAIDRGANGVVYQTGRYNPIALGDVCAIEVPDSLVALGDLAAYYRRKQILDVIGITGSVGKTTVRAMTAHLMRGLGPLVASPKSYNNAIGVPLTLFEVESDTRFGVIEMGTNSPGEIRRLAEIARPDLAVITAVAPVHVEGLGGLDGIMREKADVTHYMNADGVLVTNGDNPWCREIAGQFPGKTILFGQSETCTLRASDISRVGDGIRFVLNGEHEITLPGVRGKHNVYNALAAIGAATHFGLPTDTIAQAVNGLELPPMRLESVRVAHRLCLLDCYNANPSSVAAGLDELAHTDAPGPKVAVLGDMAELGDIAHDAHVEVGREVAALDLRAFVAVGELMAVAADAAVAASMPAERVFTFASAADTCEAIDSILPDNATFLLKGSRCMGLEAIVRHLQGDRDDGTRM